MSHFLLLKKFRLKCHTAQSNIHLMNSYKHMEPYNYQLLSHRLSKMKWGTKSSFIPAISFMNAADRIKGKSTNCIKWKIKLTSFVSLFFNHNEPENHTVFCWYFIKMVHIQEILSHLGLECFTNIAVSSP